MRASASFWMSAIVMSVHSGKNGRRSITPASRASSAVARIARGWLLAAVDQRADVLAFHDAHEIPGAR
ncbi:MAG TPA: hypothetical protein VND91_06545, partial [Candidatus Saccharimonadia bacterium]|nr:hypothetical protein [Candidatus Saccharimonadia bacterium]